MSRKTLTISFRKDLGLQLLAFYLFFVIPVVIAALVFDNYTNQRIQSDIQAADIALARAIAEETNTFIENALLSVESLANYPSVIAADTPAMEGIFEKVQSVRPDVNLIYRLDADGIMLFHYPVGGPNSTLGDDFSFREYFQAALLTQEPLVSLGRVSPTTGQPVATAVMPIWQGNDFLGLVATNIKLQSLSDTLSSITTGHNPDEFLEIIIIDADGKVIAHPDQEALLSDMSASIPEVSREVLAGSVGNLISEDENNQEQLLSYVPVPSAGWGVIVSRPTAVAFATPRAFHQGVLLVIAVFLGIGIFFWAALYWRIVRPLERLTAYSQSISKRGQVEAYSEHPLKQYSGRQDQMGQLMRSFTRMEQSIQARINELSTLLETSASVVSTLNTRAVLENILEQAERLLAIDMSAIVAMDETEGLFRARASRGLSRRYAEQLIINPDEFHSVTMRAIRTGEPIHIADTETDSTYVAFRPRARAEGYRSITAIPLNSIHAPPSALVIYQRQPKEFTAREFDLLTSFANHAAMAIENATLYERSDTALQEQTRRLEALIQSLEDGLILEDLQGKVLYINRRISEYAGLSVDRILGNSVESLFEAILENSTDKQAAFTKIKSALSNGNQEDIEIDLHGPSGLRHIRIQGFTVTDSSGLPIGRGQIILDTTKDFEVDRMKSSLISTASHELRTPLAAIKGYATTLLADDVDWEEKAQQEFLEIISLEADRLSELVTNLLDMSRIEAGSLEITRLACEIEELVDNAIQRSYPSPDDRVELQIPQDLPALFVDPQRIEVIIRNLIENAVKYTPEKTPIRIRVEVQGDRLIVFVQDEGPGIPVQKREDVFTSFFRLDDSASRQTSGAGLGLAICRGFVQAHNGQIWLEPSERGTCVAFSLPLYEADHAALEPVRDRLASE